MQKIHSHYYTNIMFIILFFFFMTFTASQCSVLSLPTCWMRLLSCYTYKSRLPLRHQGCLQYEYVNVERRDGAAFCFQLVCSCNRTFDFLCEPVFLLLSYYIYYVCKVSDFQLCLQAKTNVYEYHCNELG